MKWSKILVLIIAICLSQLTSGQKADKVSDKPITITGKVLNQNLDPIAGAVLYIDNIRTSNITKDDGTYKIKVNPSAINLGVRSAQYGNFETPINDQKIINFILNGAESKASRPTDATRDEVFDKNVKKTTRSKGKKINTYNDIYQMIRAEVNGVVVSGRSIQIRQGHSFIGSSSPLFVVNGVIVQSIDNVNPIEVQSIKVLKGSSAAIYGIQGSNGVLSITLKNGTEKEQQ